MRTVKINMSKIESASWNNGFLVIRYDSGAVVQYKDVPEGIYEGLITAVSAGSFMHRFIKGIFSYKVIKHSRINERVKSLEHHKDTTVGLWATDLPDSIPDSLKNIFFQITYDENI